MGANWQEVANAVVQRRVELGHETRKEFIEASGIGARTVGDIETARRESYDPATLARLEKALRWPAGRIQKLLATPLPEVVDLSAELMTPQGIHSNLFVPRIELTALIADSTLGPEARFDLVKLIRLKQQAFDAELAKEVAEEIRRRGGTAP